MKMKKWEEMEENEREMGGNESEMGGNEREMDLNERDEKKWMKMKKK